MKKAVKLLLLLAACCFSMSSLHAQRFNDDYRDSDVASYIDFHLGEGVGRGAQAIGALAYGTESIKRVDTTMESSRSLSS